MNQYKRLLSNTFIFAVGTFSSKILVILMLRFYTGILTQDVYKRQVNTSGLLCLRSSP